MPLADFSKTGFLGGFVQGEEHAQATQRFDVEQEQRKQELRKRTMEIDEYESEAPRRKSESTVKKQRAEREIGLKDKLDKEAETKIDTQILEMESKQDTQTLNSMYNITQGVSDQSSYDLVLENITPAQKKQWGITGKYKKDKRTLKYIGDRAQHSLSQLQAMEKIALQGQYATQRAAAGATGQSTFTPPSAGGPITGDPLGQVRLLMAQDQDFEQLIGTMSSADTSEDFLAASTLAADEAQSILQENEQARRNTKQGTVRRITFSEAVAEGKDRAKAFLYDGVEDPWFGGPQIKLKTPQQALADYAQWKQVNMGPLMQDEGFRSRIPSEQEQIMKKIYIQEQRAKLSLGQRQISTTVSNRSD